LPLALISLRSAESRIMQALRVAKLHWNRSCALLLLCASVLCATTAISQTTFTTLHSFDQTDGENPQAAILQGTDGSLYGTTAFGGNVFFHSCPGGCGTVFKITPTGTVTTLYSFCPGDGSCDTGSSPRAALVQAANGDFYGTTAPLPDYGYGTIFKMTRSGTPTALYTFCSQNSCADGESPEAALVQTSNRNFYGTTAEGGASSNCGFYGCGTVFKITPAGALTTLYSFCLQGGCVDGEYPQAVVQATDGTFYGITFGGGLVNSNCTEGCGTIFKITPAGKLTTLYRFCSQSGCTDGTGPVAALVQGTNGNFYGTTVEGGANSSCNGYACGTVFKITPAGELTTLYTFCSRSGCTDGSAPYGALVQATDRNFYGTTAGGGVNGAGTVFKITPSGTLTTLYSFCSESGCTDGDSPYAGLIQATNGAFYGTTLYGGTYGGTPGDGTIFSLSVGLGPFVETQPTSGKVGAAVKILGTDLTGATSVRFNGKAAVFKVVSRSLITTAVPQGASIGFVKVKTPSGTLKSNLQFRVKQ
jgi:uncharacterized repeat protein (TIGR03803 family)